MPNPLRGEVFVSRPLTNISIAFVQSQELFIADRVFPLVPTDLQAGLYFTYDREDWFRTDAQIRAPGAESEGSGWRVQTQSYFSQVRAIHKDIDDQIRATVSEPIRLDSDAAEWTAQQCLVRREKDWSSAYFTTGVWDVDQTGVAAAPGANQFLQWDVGGSTPIEDIHAQIIDMTAGTGFVPNVLVLGPEVFNVVRDHADILDRIKYTQRGVVTTDILAGVFGVDRVVVPMVSENTAAEGATGVFSFIYSKAALLCYANPSPSLMQPSAGYIFTWNGLLGAGAFGMRTNRFRIDERASDRIECEMAYDLGVVATSLGKFFATAVG